MEDLQPVKPPRLPLAVVLICLAVFVYALAGSPTPDNPGIVEAVIGFLLIMAVVTSSPARALSFLQERTGFLKVLQILFLTGLIIPTVSGVYLGNDRMLVLRDVLAFAFLGLALFLTDSFAASERLQRILQNILVFAGLVFCIRTLVPAFNFWVPQGELLYLSNSPLSLFAAVYLAGYAWTSLEQPDRGNLLRAVLSLAGLAILMAAMMLDVQRATIGAVWISWVVLALNTLLFRPRRLLWPLLAIGGICVLSFPLLSTAAGALATKTAEVGMNARLAEAEAVYDVLAGYSPSLIAGLGWGSTLNSPAVGGQTVNFTHSLLTTLALKGGVILFVLGCLLALAGLHQIFLIFQWDKVRGLSLFWAFIIPVFLYASHKSLDFGLILLMISVWSNRPEPLHKSHSSGKTDGHPQEMKSG